VCTDNWYSIGVCCCIQKCTAQVNFIDYVKMASKSQWVLQNKAKGSQPKLKKVNEPLYLWIPCSPYSYVHTYQRVNCGAWCRIYLCVNFLSLELCTKYWMIFGFEYKISHVLWRIVGLFTEYHQQDVTFHNLLISLKLCTWFRRFFRPSSGAQNCAYSVRYLVWQIPDAVCAVLISWWWTEKLSETCRGFYRDK